MRDLGILVLASKLISKGHSVKIIPGYYEFNETVRETTEKIKETDRCQRCNNLMKKHSRHHWFCNECWELEQIERENLALISGIKEKI